MYLLGVFVVPRQTAGKIEGDLWCQSWCEEFSRCGTDPWRWDLPVQGYGWWNEKVRERDGIWHRVPARGSGQRSNSFGKLKPVVCLNIPLVPERNALCCWVFIYCKPNSKFFIPRSLNKRTLLHSWGLCGQRCLNCRTLALTSTKKKTTLQVRVQHKTCITICGTPVQAILDQKNLTGLAGGVKEGQNMAQNGPRFYIFLASEPSRSP